MPKVSLVSSKVVRLLLEASAEKDRVDSDGFTPLTFASQDVTCVLHEWLHPLLDIITSIYGTCVC